MGKNISIYISDDLARKMENFPEVNWSEVARKGIEDYVEARAHVNIASLLLRLKREMSDLYKQGYQYGISIAEKIDFLSLEKFAKSDLCGYWRDDEDYVPDPAVAICSALKKINIHPPFESETFLKGIKDALLEVYSKVLSKQ